MKSARTAPDAIVRVHGVTTGYGDKLILEEVSFDVAPGEVLVILGGSGSGKSTLLKNMVGLYRPRAGSIEIAGDDIVRAGDLTRPRILRRFGVMYQSGALFGSMTVLDNVCLPLREFTGLPADAVETIGRLKLHLVGLDGAAELLPAELSGGMVKRAAIARAMALDPEILFLDEPSAGLDPITAAGLDHLILSLRDALGMTFVVVTHELASIFAIADRVVMLDSRTRRVAAIGTPQELRQSARDEWVRRFFNRQAAED